MTTKEDRERFRIIGEKIEKNFLQKLEIEETFWQTMYQTLSIDKRLEFWLTEVDRYEHMVGGEFDPKSIQLEVSYFFKVIRKIDKESNKVLDNLILRLLDNYLQNEDISQYMAEKFKELM